MPPNFAIVQDDIRNVTADLILLKYARELHGVGQAVASALADAKICNSDQLEVSVDDFVIVETKGALTAPYVMFLGTPALHEFGYQEIEHFGYRAMEIIAQQLGSVRRLATTIHGTGYGLDGEEALISLIKGFERARQKWSASFPPRIMFCELNPRLAQGLSIALKSASDALDVPDETQIRKPLAASLLVTQSRDNQDKSESGETSVGRAEPKKHIFVAMPFSEDFEDVYEFGIYAPVRKCGYICEKTSESHFTGDIMHRVKDKIETAHLVIAEMTGARPNVYLEIGYAWGKGIPVIMLARRGENLHFDVSRDRCLFYDSIRQLARDLEKLVAGLTPMAH